MKGLFVLCLCLSFRFGGSQFSFFNRERQPLNIAKGIGNLRETIGGILRPHSRQPVVNQNGDNDYSQRPVLFPTSSPDEAPNYGQGNQQYDQGNQQYDQGNQNGEGNQGQNDQVETQSPFPGQDQSGQEHQPGPGQVNVVDNASYQDNQGSYNGPNDSVNFEESQTPAPAPFSTTPQTESRNNFNFEHVPQFSETCRTADDGAGSCINLNSCQPFMRVVQEARSSPAAVKMLRQAHCGFDGNYPKVCCPLPGLPTIAPVTSAPTEPPTEPPTEAPTAAPKTADDGDFISSLPTPPVCGTSNTTLSRVVGGLPAKLGAFPWMALLGYHRGDDTRWLCGGSLITARHVLTAAHCIHNHEKDLYLVRLGELDLARDDEGATPVDILIKKQIKHENYNAKAFSHDIALLLLQKDVQFTSLIRPICIPTTSELRARSFEDYNPFIAGWGDTEFRGPAATHLQVLQLPVVSTEFCQQAYSAYKSQQIDEKVLCAGFKQGGRDACQGDSGGPLMQPVPLPEKRIFPMYQIGVVSFGKKCAEAGFPGVYSRVTYFVPWIQEKVLGASR